MSEIWSNWGSTGPILGIIVNITNNKTTSEVNYSFQLKGRYNYNSSGISSAFYTDWYIHVNDNLTGTGSVNPWKNKQYTEVLAAGTSSVERKEYEQTLVLTLSVDSWGGVTWNGITGDDSVSLTITIPSINSMSAPTISTTHKIYAPSTNSFTVSWNSIANASYYNLYVKDNIGNFILNKTAVYGSSKTFTVSNLSEYRGRIFTAYVQAVSGNTAVADSSYSSQKIATINSLPGAPSVSQSGTIVDSTNSVVFTVNSGTDSDSSQTKTLYYSLDKGITKQKFISPLTITTSTTEGGGIVSGSNTIFFYTFDGLEYSNTYTSKTFTANFAPVIGTITTKHTYIEDMNGSLNSLVSNTKIIFSLSSGSAKQVQVYMRQGASSSISGEGKIISNSYYTYNEATKTISIDIIKFSSSELPYGNYFQFAFKISDGVAYSSLSSWQTIGRRPLKPRLPVYNSYLNDSDNKYGAIAKNNYYKTKVIINFTNLEAASGYAKISLVEIIASYSNSSKSYSCPTTAGSNQVELNLSQVTPNASTSFVFKITDMAGQSVASNSTFLTLIKASNLVYAGSTVNVTSENFKPMTNTQPFQIAHPLASVTGTESIKYIYKIKVGSVEKPINTFTTSSTPDQMIIIISADDMNSLALSLVTNKNIAYDATITITAADGFASTISLTKIIKINFTEPPAFISSAPLFKIRHDYEISNSLSNSSVGIEITPTSSLDERMVNMGEGIIFVLPKATDPNNDIEEYRIFLSRNDFTGTENILASSAVVFGTLPWLSIPYSVLENGFSDDDYYYYRYKASQYIKNEYFYFKVQVKDKTGNVSKEVICNNYLIGCRTVGSTFSTGNIDVSRIGTTVTLKYNFKITDLGGSATSNGWDVNFYKNYPNFERTINGYTPMATLKIEIAPDQSFTENVLSIIQTGGENSLLEFTSTKATFTNFSENHAKIFMKFTLILSYGLNSSNEDGRAVISSSPQVYTFFGSVPTVAHRAHRVGINTNALGQDDVFVVENYQGSKYIVFKGTDAQNANKSYEIRINLVEGLISGTKTEDGKSIAYFKIDGATIDGGEW